MTIPFRSVPRAASWVATHKEVEMARHPKTLVELSRQLGVTRKTAWPVRRKIIAAMARGEGELMLRADVDEGLP